VRWAAVVGVLATLIVAVAPAAQGGARLRPDPCPMGKGVRMIRFPTSDGIRLQGAIVGRGPVGVVLAHQSNGTICQWLPFARRLARHYMAMPIDLRGHGQSPTGPEATFDRYDLDVVAAVAALRARGSQHVYVVGASLGGTAVLVAAAETHVDGVVDLSGPAQYPPLDAAAAMPNLTAPALFMAGASDTDFVGDTRALYDAAGSTDKRLRVYPTGAHGVGLLTSRPAPTGSQLIQNFIAWHVKHS
jgi:alpha-beta hydrolase superfamily lysophospholipase